MMYVYFVSFIDYNNVFGNLEIEISSKITKLKQIHRIAEKVEENLNQPAKSVVIINYKFLRKERSIWNFLKTN